MMLRTYIVWVALTLFVFAQTQTLLDASIRLPSYHQKLALKLKNRKKLELLARISRSEAAKKAEKLCNEAVTSQYIDHQGQLLYYLLHTPNCRVKINALDGKTISLTRKNKTNKETDK